VSSRWTPALEDYIEFAAYLLDLEPSGVRALPRITLAESAIHAPFASYGGAPAYPTLIEQAAVLVEHLTNNHPLPDGNKRAGSLSPRVSSTRTA
jgi:death on curing protein